MILRSNHDKSFHLNLERRKLLLVRLHFARNLDANPLPGRAASIVKDMHNNACGTADNTAMRSHEVRLDSSLKEVFADAKKACPKKNGLDPNRHEILIRKGTAGFGRDVRSTNCSRCAKERGNHVCNGDEINDNKTVKNNGECWKPLQELFDLALEETRKSYNAYAHGFSDRNNTHQVVEITFKTLQSATSNIEPQTEFSDNQETNCHYSIAKMGLPIKQFNAKAYFDLLYAFFHELMVHSVQSILSPSERRPFGESCPFGEGLVDAVAYHLLERLLNDPGQLPSSIKPFAPRFLQRAMSLHLERRDHVRVPHREDGEKNRAETNAIHARSQGREAFDFLLKERGDTWLFKLVLSLNLEGLSRPEREELVSLMGEACTRMDEARRETGVSTSELPKEDKLLNMLDNYVDTGNLQNLRYSILELKP